MSVGPEISVVVPHYDDLARLSLCLDALGRQTTSRRFEIVVADNNSPQGLAEVERAVAGRARVVLVTEKGAGPARNGAVAASRGTVLAFTDSDCVPSPGWLEAGVSGLDRFEVVGGHVSVGVADPNRITPVEAFERVFAFDFKTYIERKRFTGSGNMFCRRETFDRVGGFRPAVSEDVDWSHRAVAMGFSLGYVREAEVTHPARREWGELQLKWEKATREAFHLAREKSGWRARWIAYGLALPFSAVVHTPKVLRSPGLARARDRLAALNTLYRVRLWRARETFRLLAKGVA